MKYKLQGYTGPLRNDGAPTPDYGVRRDDGASIPNDPDNKDWQEYQEWLADPANIPDSQYTLAEIKATKLNQVRREAGQIISVKWPLFKQINADGGRYPLAVKTQMDADITSVVAASNMAEDAVVAALTEADVDAVNPVWPAI